MIKSCVTFFRRQLKIKGSTDHDGRGCYEMEFDCSVADLQRRVDDLITAHPDMFDVTRDADNASVTVTIKQEFAPDQSYRTLLLNPHTPHYTLNVVMA